MNIIPSAKANIILDASKIDLFETCPARYNYKYNHNKVLPQSSKSPSQRDALDLGTLAHEGLGTYYSLLGEGKDYPTRMDAALMKIRELSSDPEKSHSSTEEVSIVLSAVEQACDFWRAEDENCLEVLAVEQPFAYELFSDDSVRILLSGKIDLLCNFNGIGRNASYKNLIMDHKTYSRDSVVLRKSNQFINYCCAVGSNYLVVNRIGLHNPTAKQAKTAEEKFKRLPLSYDPVYLQSWKDNITKIILGEYLNCVAMDEWPEKCTSCNKFNRLCEYFPISDMSGTKEDKLAKLYSEYVDGEVWDVTKGMLGGVE